MARRGKKIRIAGTGQLLQHHNPVRVAEEIGMLDNLTGGRVIMAFLRGIPGEDLPYSINPAEGRGRLLPKCIIPHRPQGRDEGNRMVSRMPPRFCDQEMKGSRLKRLV